MWIKVTVILSELPTFIFGLIDTKLGDEEFHIRYLCINQVLENGQTVLNSYLQLS